MGNLRFYHCTVMCLLVLFLPETCLASIQNYGKITPTFQGSPMNWIDNSGLFLLSNSSNFAFGFITTRDVTLFLLAIVHKSTSTIIWSANRNSPIRNSDDFVFDDSGNAYLQSAGAVVWSTDTAKKGVAAMELLESGNLVLVGNNGNVIWQSFDHPTNTLSSDQQFNEGMKLVSDPNNNNLSYSLEIKSGDMILSAGYQPPQPYWTMTNDNRRIINKDGGDAYSATINGNSWRFYDQSKALLWQFVFSDDTSNANSTWIAILGNDGYISFNSLQVRGASKISTTIIPSDSCRRPLPCDPYVVCYEGNRCQCPQSLSALANCRSDITAPCNKSTGDVDLVDVGNSLSYFAIGFVPPSLKADLNRCKDSCLKNCSCMALFFVNKSGDCYLFNQLGSLQDSGNDAGILSYVKVLSSGGNGGGTNSSNGNHYPVIITIAVVTVFIILGLLYGGFRLYKRKSREMPQSPMETSEEDNFLENLAGMPVRYSYHDLQMATSNFSEKLGQGGFGSVYKGVLANETRLAVKKLESIGQGKKEFRAEVSIIGSIHHHHLVRLRGFCAEGAHRLLAYEFMANGSLDRWLFRKEKEEFMLDWDTRYNIAVGTAKGLAYLHEDCDAKIVHCDIKPENVLLDENFIAKVSDFGLAKLMTREQSHVFTTLRGTRGYLAPEWITNYAISEKSDVYSYGMVLLEIIGGRKNYDPSEPSERSHFPSYAFRMMEEGKLKDIIDSALKIDEADWRASVAIKVALWCIQDDVYLRPSMANVVQMLEGLSAVPPLPNLSQTGPRFFSGFIKSSSEATSSGPSDCNSDAYLSAMRLSGPR